MEPDRSKLPICVDLDGTLVLTDTLIECVLRSIRSRPLSVFTLPFRALRGKAALKTHLAGLAPAACYLPYHPDFLAFLRKEASVGRRLVLATAADRAVADSVAAHLGLFQTIIASDGQRNVKGVEKLDAIRAEFNNEPFAYAGNSSADLPIWEGAAECIVVNAGPSLARKIAQRGVPTREFPASRVSVRTILRQCRVHQWSKNVLVFLPALFGHRIFEAKVFLAAVLAMLCFSLTASAIYLINDLLDLDTDRAHPTKRRRPLASGELPISWGVAVLVVLLLGAGILASFLPLNSSGLLIAYVAANIAYSGWLKKMLVIDVVTLAGFYSLRVLIGGAATGIAVSSWAIVFTTFLFFSLGLAKRLNDLKYSGVDQQMPGRGYQDVDRNMVGSLASATSVTAILVLALYIKSSDVELLYHRPDALLLICPVLAYWLWRMLILAQRGRINDDPVTFALKDRASYAVGLLVALLIWIAV